MTHIQCRYHMRLPSLNRQAAHDALKQGVFRLVDWSEMVLPHIPVSHQEQSVIIRKLAPADIGFSHGASWGDILLRAKGRGLSLVPQKYILALRLMYLHQPEEEYARIAHTPVSHGEDGPLFIFGMSNMRGSDPGGSKLGLHAREFGGMAAVWPRNTKFFFIESFYDA